MLDFIVTYWPILAFIGGLVFSAFQAWALKMQYRLDKKIDAVIADNDKRQLRDDARFNALELEVSTKINAEQARTVAHQYHTDREQMRAQIMREIEERENK